MAIEHHFVQEEYHFDKGFDWCSSLLTGLISEGTQVVIVNSGMSYVMDVCVCVRANHLVIQWITNLFPFALCIFH